MKKIITLITIFILVCNVSFAQNTIAKLKFEDAEEAYTNNNFELTLSKIKEVEKLLNSSNPKLLYLEVMAQSKIIEKNPLKDYNIIKAARKSSEKYLRAYDNLPDNEDKYRDIYKISEKLNSYPKNEIEFDEMKNKSKRITDSILNLSKYKLLITEEEFKKLYPESKSIFSPTASKIYGGFYKYQNDLNRGLIEVFSQNNRVSSYCYKIQKCKSEVEAEAAYKEYEKNFDENLFLVTSKSSCEDVAILKPNSSSESSGWRRYKVKEDDTYYIELYRSYTSIYIDYSP